MKAGAKVSLRFSKYFGKRRLMDAFKKFKSRTIVKSKVDLSKKSILSHFLTHRFRAYFNKWKNEAQN